METKSRKLIKKENVDGIEISIHHVQDADKESYEVCRERDEVKAKDREVSVFNTKREAKEYFEYLSAAYAFFPSEMENKGEVSLSATMEVKAEHNLIDEIKEKARALGVNDNFLDEVATTAMSHSQEDSFSVSKAVSEAIVAVTGNNDAPYRHIFGKGNNKGLYDNEEQEAENTNQLKI
jgi:hypothetical protein